MVLSRHIRLGFDRFSLHLLHLGFKCSKADSSLFILQCGKGTILLLLYVWITGSSSEIITGLANEFSMKDLGPLHFFLGIEVKYFKRGMHLSQGKYAPELLQKTDMALAQAVSAPLAQKHSLQQVTGSPVDASSYRSIAGSLQYITLSRPDITHAINLVSQLMQAQNSEHLQAIKRILRYVKETYQFGLRLPARSPLRQYGFSDADCEVVQLQGGQPQDIKYI